jgi:hypothetical protein
MHRCARTHACDHAHEQTGVNEDAIAFNVGEDFAEWFPALFVKVQ